MELVPGSEWGLVQVLTPVKYLNLEMLKLLELVLDLVRA